MSAIVTKEAIESIVEENMEEALQLLSEALQSPSPTCSEAPMGETFSKWMEKFGLDYKVYTYHEGQPNVVGTLKGEGEKSFVFDGHMDVFPPAGTDDPDYDPWSGEIKDGKVYGRGASDMKGGDCAAFMAVHLLDKMGWKPSGKVMLAFVSDEERGGTYGTLSLIKDGIINADYGLSMEPSGCRTTVHHGGVYPFKVTVYGDGGAASEELHGPEYDPLNIYGGEDAIHKIMKAVKAIDELNETVIKKKPTVHGMLSHLAITNIHGGKTNVINNQCREAFLLIDRRFIPGETPESITKELEDALEGVKKIDPYFAYKLEGPVEPYCPILDFPDDDPVVMALDKAHEAFYGTPTEHITMLAGSDAAYLAEFCKTSIPWYGPGAHEFGVAAKGEYVTIENYKNCIKMYMHVLADLMS